MKQNGDFWYRHYYFGCIFYLLKQHLLSNITILPPWQMNCCGYSISTIVSVLHFVKINSGFIGHARNYVWGLMSAPNYPVIQTPTREPVTPAVDPRPLVTPTPSSSLFAEISKKLSTKTLSLQRKPRLRNKFSYTTVIKFSTIWNAGKLWGTASLCGT